MVQSIMYTGFISWTFFFICMILHPLHLTSFSTSKTRVPIIFDNDGNYDDILAFFYLAKSPVVEIKAITVEATGMSTAHGGPVNMHKIASFLGLDVPIGYGVPLSLSPIVSYPLEWRVRLDLFIEKMTEEGLFETGFSNTILSAPALMAKILRESDVPVNFVCTGPVTNIATMLQMAPELNDRIGSIFFMGSAYQSENNVYDWQLRFNNVFGSCSESLGLGIGPQVLDLKSLGYSTNETNFSNVRPGCRGVNMTKKGNTEWNIFPDARAWDIMMQSLSPSSRVYISTVGATYHMWVTLDSFNKSLKSVKNSTEQKILWELAQQFLLSGEAKWWDAQNAVMAVNILRGQQRGANAVCSKWIEKKKVRVSLDWQSQNAGKNPYGSIVDDPTGHVMDFCVDDKDKRTVMDKLYWSLLNGSDNSTIPVKDISFYFRLLPSFNNCRCDVSFSTNDSKLVIAAITISSLAILLSLTTCHLLYFITKRKTNFVVLQNESFQSLKNGNQI